MAKDSLIIFLKSLNTIALIFIAFAVSIYVYYWLHKYNEGCAKSANVENFVETLDLPSSQMFVTSDGSTITPFKFDGIDTLPEITIKNGGKICIGTGSEKYCLNSKNFKDIVTNTTFVDKTRSGIGWAARWGLKTIEIADLPINFTGTFDVISSIGTRVTYFITTDTEQVTQEKQILNKTVIVNKTMEEYTGIQFVRLKVFAGSAFTGPYLVYWTLQSLTNPIPQL